MKKSILLSSLFLVLPAIPLLSQERSNPVTINADEVLVTTSRTEGSAKKSERSVRVITARDIEEKNATNVGDLLADVPGVTLTDTGIAGMKRIRIRGEASYRTLIIIDGIKISEQKSMNGSPILIDVASIERIEVIIGSASVLYGSEAIGGVVNIITKKGGNRPVQAETGVGWDSSANVFTTHSSVYGSVEGFKYRLGGSYVNAGDRVVAQGKTIPFTDFSNYNFNNHLAYDWRDGGVFVNHQSFRSKSKVTKTMRLDNWDRDRVTLGVEQFNLGALAKLSVTGTYQRAYKDFLFVPMESKNTQHEGHFVAQTDWELPWDNTLIAGAEYNFTFLDANTLGRGKTILQANENSLGLFAHNKWQILPDFALSAGLRYTFMGTNLTSSNDPRSPVNQNNNNSVVGSFGFLYDIAEVANLRFHYGSGFKNPSMTQTLLYSPSHGYGSILPNLNLRPELAHNFEVGFRYFDWGFNLDTALAYNLGMDYIALTEVGTSTPQNRQYTHSNVQTAHSVSAELRLSYDIPVVGISPYFNGSYQYTRYINENWSTQKTGTPPWQLKSGLKFAKEVHPLLSLRADANVAWNSFAEEENYSTKRITPYKDWYTLNLSTGLAFGKASEEWVFLNAGISNLLDTKYKPAGMNLEASGRAFFVNLTLKI